MPRSAGPIGPAAGVVLALGLAWASASTVHAAPPAATEGAATEGAATEGAATEGAATEGAAPSCDDASGETCAPPEPQTAIEWYARGIELANAEDYAAAAAAFMRSYELHPTSEALFNAAYAHENAGATLDAIRSYERFLAEPERKEDRVPLAQRSIDTLMSEVALLKGVRYDAARAPAELLVDGQRVELDGFPLLIMPGEIEIEVVDEGGKHARETYELAAGDALVVDLRALLSPPPVEPPGPNLIEDEGPSEAELEAARLRARRARTLRKVTWVGVGLTGATAVSAATLGIVAAVERRAYDTDNCLDFPGGVCPDGHAVGDPLGHYTAYKRYALSAVVLASVGGGLAVATLVVGLVSRRYERRNNRGNNRGGRASVHLAPGASGLVLRF